MKMTGARITNGRSIKGMARMNYGGEAPLCVFHPVRAFRYRALRGSDVAIVKLTRSVELSPLSLPFLIDTAPKMMDDPPPSRLLADSNIGRGVTFLGLCVAARCEPSGIRSLLPEPDRPLGHIAQDQTGCRDGMP